MYNLTTCVCFCVFTCVLGAKSQLYNGDSCMSAIDRFNGTCVQAHRCLSTVNDIKKGIQPQLCSFDGHEAIICCTDCDLVRNTSIALVNTKGDHFFKTGSKAEDKCLEYIANLKYPCYLRTGVRRMVNLYRGDCYHYSSMYEPTTVGGDNAERGEFPHTALLGYGDSIETAQWVCGGSVVSERFILTAAHCISSSTLGAVKYIGLGVLKRSDPPKTWQLYNVSKIIPHPQYKSPSKYHDIALLETETKITFNRYVLPACLSTGDDDDSSASATGWGALGYRKDLADNLQVVYLKQFSEEECASAYPPNRNLQKGYDHTIQSCYGDKEHVINTCQGDSGGPLHTISTHGFCVFNIIGVTSFGAACSFLGSPGVYTKVLHYVSWIENIVWP